MPGSLVIRLTTAADIHPITELTNEQIRDGVAHFGFEPIEPSDLHQQWERQRSRYAWLTAEVDGAFAGFAKASAWKSREAYEWTIEVSVYIVGRFRGRGIAKELYIKLFDVSGRQGYHAALAGVVVPNAASERLHESVGMQLAGSLGLIGYKHDAWREVVYYRMPLLDQPDGVMPGPIRQVQEVIALD